MKISVHLLRSPWPNLIIMVFKEKLLVLVLFSSVLAVSSSFLFYFFKANVEFRPDGTVFNSFGTSSLKTINVIKKRRKLLQCTSTQNGTIERNNFSVKFVWAKTHRPYVFRGPGSKILWVTYE